MAYRKRKNYGRKSSYRGKKFGKRRGRAKSIPKIRMSRGGRKIA